MKRAFAVALMLMGLLIAGSVTASSAMAGLPEWEKTADLTSAFSENHTALLKTTGGAMVTCKMSSFTGEVATAKAKNLKEMSFTFHECAKETFKCTTTGLAEGDIASEHLEAEVGYLESESMVGAKKVALAVFPASGSVISKFTCNMVNYQYLGCVIGVASETNALVEFYGLVFEEATGVQKFIKYEPLKGTKKECAGKLKIGGVEAGVGLQTTQTMSVIITHEEKLNA